MTNLKTVDEMASGVYDYESAFDALTQYRQSHCDELVRLGERCRPKVKSQDFSLQGIYNEGYEQGKKDVLTIVKEVYKNTNK